MSVLTKLFLIATLALSAASAQESSGEAAAPSSAAAAPSSPADSAAGGFQFKETYPTDGSVPTPKQEWMAIIASANITDAPVLKASGDSGPQQSGSDDPYCDWTFTGCTRPEDIVACPKGQWGITYDDGPTDFSPQLYDFLDQSQQKATFFMIGGQVIKYPQHVQRAFKAGHEMAIHTWSHSYLTTLTTEQIVGELKWTETAIKEVTGYSPRFFRPPYGDIDDRVRSIATALGFTPVIWNYDTDDWMAVESPGFDVQWIDGNATEWANAAQTSQEGGISLEHDLYNVTVDAAIRILPTLQKAYKVTTVGQCSGQQSYKEGAAANATSSAAPSSASSTSSASGVKPDGSSSASSDEAQEGAASHLVARTAIGAVALIGAVSYLVA